MSLTSFRQFEQMYHYEVIIEFETDSFAKLILF